MSIIITETAKDFDFFPFVISVVQKCFFLTVNILVGDNYHDNYQRLIFWIFSNPDHKQSKPFVESIEN